MQLSASTGGMALLSTSTGPSPKRPLQRVGRENVQTGQIPPNRPQGRRPPATGRPASTPPMLTYYISVMKCCRNILTRRRWVGVAKVRSEERANTGTSITRRARS